MCRRDGVKEMCFEIFIDGSEATRAESEASARATYRVKAVLAKSSGPRCRTLIALTLFTCVWAPGSPSRADDKSDQPKRDKLGERLIRESTSGSEDIMAETVRLMGESARQLDVKFDAGPDTQSVQREIVANLEEAIKFAAAQRRMTRQSSPSQSGDKRRMPGDKPHDAQADEQSAEKGASGDPGASIDSGGVAEVSNQTEGLLKETRQAWGHLPQRQREELIQGKDEAFLEEYRAWIELYFKALQESE